MSRAWPWMAAMAPALALLAGCSTATPRASVPAPAEGYEEVGIASWYGAQHHGKRTASGEIFDMNRLTAAHRSLPFGTRLLVTNRDNNRTTEVRVNDRGPFVKGRILDVSYAAARQLGALGSGTFAVRLRVIALPTTPASTTPDTPDLERGASAYRRDGGLMMR